MDLTTKWFVAYKQNPTDAKCEATLDIKDVHRYTADSQFGLRIPASLPVSVGRIYICCDTTDGERNTPFELIEVSGQPTIDRVHQPCGVGGSNPRWVYVFGTKFKQASRILLATEMSGSTAAANSSSTTAIAATIYSVTELGFQMPDGIKPGSAVNICVKGSENDQPSMPFSLTVL